MDLDRAEIEVLRHAIGADRFGQVSNPRNVFMTACDGSDGRVCLGLVAKGLMKDLGCGGELSGGDNVFIVTQAGRDAVAATAEKPPRLTRSQRRYREFLRCDFGLSFGEWLKKSH